MAYYKLARFGFTSKRDLLISRLNIARERDTLKTENEKLRSDVERLHKLLFEIKQITNQYE